MVNFGTAVIVFRDHEVLLIKREDFEVWAPPGGSIDPGESVSDAAIREVREETGLEVQLIHLVGIYSRPKWDSHIIMFAAQAARGVMRPQANEVVDAQFFDINALPPDLIWWYRQPISDAINGVGGSAAWSQDALWPIGIDTQNRQLLYDQRDQSGLSRTEFYNKHLGQIGLDGEQRAV